MTRSPIGVITVVLLSLRCVMSRLVLAGSGLVLSRFINQKSVDVIPLWTIAKHLSKNNQYNGDLYFERYLSSEYDLFNYDFN